MASEAPVKYHIVLHRPIDLKDIAQKAEMAQSPRHGMGLLAQRLNAQVHQPQGLPLSLSDRLQAKLVNSPESWALARSLKSQVGAEDCIFCTSEAGGLQIAAVCGAQRDRPQLAVFVHNLDRPRGRLALKLWQAAKRIDLFLACSQLQIDFLRQYLPISPTQVRFIWDHVDTQFFTPGLPTAAKKRPQIVSVGLEQRDYRTLAAATADLAVDVKISGFSRDAVALAQAMPDPLPANMSRQFYAWPELVQLYRDADVVVVSVRENRYAAGVQALMEAMACQRPVVVTATAGLSAYLNPEAVTCIQPGDVQQMRQAILHYLDHPDTALAKAQYGYQLAQEKHTMERYTEDVAACLQSL